MLFYIIKNFQIKSLNDSEFAKARAYFPQKKENITAIARLSKNVSLINILSTI